MSRERPIIFCSDGVRAILDGRKTQTRRVIRPQPIGHRTCWSDDLEVGDLYIETDESVWKACESTGRNKKAAGELTPKEIKCPYGKIGDRLWVREGYRIIKGYWRRETLYGEYLIDGKRFNAEVTGREYKLFKMRQSPCRKTSARFMYKSLARIWLEITNITVERLQDITEQDAITEGCRALKTIDTYQNKGSVTRAKWLYQRIWDSLNAKRGYPWEKNPWVWVIEFKKL